MCIPPKKLKVKKKPKKSPAVVEEEAALFILIVSLVFVLSKLGAFHLEFTTRNKFFKNAAEQYFYL
jgi:hypothetical protein